MPYSLTWLPQVLRAAGLKVAEVNGWVDRGRGPMGVVRGVVCHHTGTTVPGNMPTLRMLVEGRSDLPGPLAQLGLGRDGTYYVVAAGRSNHAGKGQWRGISGNSSFIGIEGENAGTKADTWPDVQMDAYRRGVAAILNRLGVGAEMCCGHKEYAPGRKDDPLFDMDDFRAAVRDLMRGSGSVRPLIPAVAPSGKETIRRGTRGNLVSSLQHHLGLPEDGIFGSGTEAAVRKFQQAHGLEVPDGIVGPKTWAVIEPA